MSGRLVASHPVKRVESPDLSGHRPSLAEPPPEAPETPANTPVCRLSAVLSSRSTGGMSGSQATPTDAAINVSSSNRQSSPQPMEARRIDTDVASSSLPIAAFGVQREGPSDQSKLLVSPMHSGTSWIRAGQSGTHDVSSQKKFDTLAEAQASFLMPRPKTESLGPRGTTSATLKYQGARHFAAPYEAQMPPVNGPMAERFPF